MAICVGVLDDFVAMVLWAVFVPVIGKLEVKTSSGRSNAKPDGEIGENEKPHRGSNVAANAQCFVYRISQNKIFSAHRAATVLLGSDINLRYPVKA
jgi:hypothetical protein